MGLLSLLGIAFGLAMDVFSVAVASGLTLGKVSPRQAFRLSFHFGLFQFGMPIIGWVLGTLVSEQIRGFDHWLAFLLLGGVGSKMIWEALKGADDHPRGDPTKGLTLVVLSVATSIDAMAIGLSLALVQVPVLLPAIVIGAVAGNMSILGLYLGKKVGHLLGRKMEVAGGLVLLAIGVKIVMEHLGA